MMPPTIDGQTLVDTPAGKLVAVGEHWHIAPNPPPHASGNQWYCLHVPLPPTPSPRRVSVHWPPTQTEPSRDYNSNHNFAEVLDRVLFVRSPGSEWSRLTDVEREGCSESGLSESVLSVSVTLPASHEPREFAVDIPTGPADLAALLDAARRHEAARVLEIGCSARDLPIHAIAIEPPTARGTFVLTAHQHFSEWASIRVLDALLEHLLGDAGRPLRQRWRWLIVPCINVDALHLGWPADRLVTEGVNFNRDWSKLACVETRAVASFLQQHHRSGPPVRHALDLHMGWHSRATCGAGLTVFRDGHAPAELIARQRAFAEALIASADYTDFIWNAGQIDRPNLAAWASRELGAIGQTLEISRHRWRRRRDGRWLPPSVALQRALGPAIADTLDAFHR